MKKLRHSMYIALRSIYFPALLPVLLAFGYIYVERDHEYPVYTTQPVGQPVVSCKRGRKDTLTDTDGRVQRRGNNLCLYFYGRVSHTISTS